MEIEQKNTIVEQKEVLKLTRNSKGYGWEIKVFPKSDNDKEWLDRLAKINDVLMERFDLE